MGEIKLVKKIIKNGQSRVEVGGEECIPPLLYGMELVDQCISYPIFAPISNCICDVI